MAMVVTLTVLSEGIAAMPAIITAATLSDTTKRDATIFSPISVFFSCFFPFQIGSQTRGRKKITDKFKFVAKYELKKLIVGNMPDTDSMLTVFFFLSRAA